MIYEDLKGVGNRFSYVPVANVATPIIGGTPSRSISAYWGGSIKWAAAKDIVSVKGRYLYFTEESITQEGIDNSAAKILPRGTVVITARGTVGALVQLGEDMAFNQTCYGLVANEAILPDFLYYALKGSLSEMRSLSYGTIFDTITIKTFNHLTIPLPSLSEQKAIASILGALDDKIELNRKMNETLEAMARAIFKSCFSYPFDGLKYLQAETPLPDLTGHPLPLGEGRGEGELELVDSPLGRIPKGWRVGTIGDIAHLNREVISPANFPTEKFEHFSIPAFDEGQMPVQELGSVIKSNKFLMPNNCILISKLNPRIPRIWLPKINKSYRSVASTEFLVLTSKAPFTSAFIYCLCNSSVFQDAFVSLVTGTSSSHQRVKPDDFLKIQVICPSDIVLQKFADRAEPLFTRVQLNNEQSLTLASIRDALLPKLLSGEIRVKDAERFVEEKI